MNTRLLKGLKWPNRPNPSLIRGNQLLGLQQRFAMHPFILRVVFFIYICIYIYRWVPLSDLEHGVSEVCPEPVESYQSVSGPHPMTPQTRVVSLTFMHAFISLSSLSLYNKVIVLYMSPGFWRFAG